MRAKAVGETPLANRHGRADHGPATFKLFIVLA
jgi:hypothetical protein